MSVEEDAASLLRTFAACIVQAHVRGFQQRTRFLRQVYAQLGLGCAVAKIITCELVTESRRQVHPALLAASQLPPAIHQQSRFQDTGGLAQPLPTQALLVLQRPDTFQVTRQH